MDVDVNTDDFNRVNNVNTDDFNTVELKNASFTNVVNELHSKTKTFGNTKDNDKRKTDF